MNTQKRLNNILENAKGIHLGGGRKIVLISDCHRGVGSGADNFAKNQNLYYVAMEHYKKEGFTYIELGDGDELWENKYYPDIAKEYSHIFELLSEMYREGRMYMLYGNHDMEKKNKHWVQRNLYARMCDRENGPTPLFPGIEPLEAIVLRIPECSGEILLVHGHQVDFLNYDLWRLSKLLVRYVWQPLELIGVRDPFSTAKNDKRRLSVEGRLTAWSQKTGRMLVAGHTHRPAFPKAGEALYFNDGSCVHPRHISAIEIEDCKISLVRWRITTGRGGVLLVSREIEDGPEELKNYFTRE